VSVPVPPGAVAQLPLALRFPPDQRFETFAAAPAGALAQLCAQARGEGAAGGIFVCGPAGMGKTHLLLAACAEAEAAGHRTAYLPIAAAAGRLRDALDAFEHADLLALGLALPDLRSRLGQCARIALEPLDDAGRAEVLRLRAQRRGLQLEDAAIDWLLRRVDRDLASLTALFDRLDRESLAAQRRLTVPFLRGVLGG
jgi:DnaA family protein